MWKELQDNARSAQCQAGFQRGKTDFKSGTAVPIMTTDRIMYRLNSGDRCAKSQFVKLLETG